MLEWDLLARTVGIRRIAAQEWPKPRQRDPGFLQALPWSQRPYRRLGDKLPIEFSLLDYRPEPWTPLDCLTIEGEFRWYLTGRFPIIVMPELARRGLGAGPLYQAYLQAERTRKASFTPAIMPTRPEGTRSSRWVQPSARPGRRAAAIIGWCPGGWPRGASPCWPAIPMAVRRGVVVVRGSPVRRVVPRGRHGVCRVRSSFRPERAGRLGLHQQHLLAARPVPGKNRSATPGAFLPRWCLGAGPRTGGSNWVKGARPCVRQFAIRAMGRWWMRCCPRWPGQTGPVSLKWLGASRGRLADALLGINRARSAGEFHEAMRPWHVPTFAVVYADVEGHIGYQAVGRVPIRKISERGYRPGWEPEHQWQGLIPYEGMPGVQEPKRGWVVTANNRPAPEDFPYPLSGTWGDAHRAVRIREMLTAGPTATVARFRDMHQDALSLRALRVKPGLLAALEGETARFVQACAWLLRDWDGHMEVRHRIGATIFEVFFARWVRRVVRGGSRGRRGRAFGRRWNGLATALLDGDPLGVVPSQRPSDGHPGDDARGVGVPGQAPGAGHQRLAVGSAARAAVAARALSESLWATLGSFWTRGAWP